MLGVRRKYCVAHVKAGGLDGYLRAARIRSDPRLQTAAKLPPEPPATPGGGRLMSLDVFRGATIASMMLVNNPGTWSHIYPQLDHAEWNGWTFTDVIFPFFLWIVGVAIPLSTAKRLARGENRITLLTHAVRRAAIIFSLGLFLAFLTYVLNGSYAQLGGFGPWIKEVVTTIRIPGVLQRIAVCYLFASAIYLGAGLRGQVVWLIGLLAGYWALMAWVPAPGHGAGDLSKEGNFSAYVDTLVLGKHTLLGRPWDPEGIVSTMPAIATCLFGILAGQLLLIQRSVEQKTAWLFVGGNILMLAGAILNIWLPINKNLWTSSYSVFMAGLAMDVFAVFYWLVDVKQYQKWAKPFAIYGMNAITVFMASGILGRLWLNAKLNRGGNSVSLQTWLYRTIFEIPLSQIGFAPNNCSLAWALAYTAMLYLLAWVMYRRKWVIKF